MSTLNGNGAPQADERQFISEATGSLCGGTEDL